MDYKQNYEKWLNFEGLDKSLKTELMSMDESTKEDAFYKNIEFGTAGMRGLLGAGTNRLNIYMIRKANVGYAKWILQQPDGANRGVAISYDNRHMSYIFANESAKVLAGFGIKTYLMECLKPTPELSFAVRYFKCAGGIMITASHNPAEYNGYKVYDDTGCQLIPEWADQVTQYVNEVENELEVKVPSDDEAYDYINWVGEEVDRAYYDAVKTCEINSGLDKKDFKIVYSPQHGADNWPVRIVLKELGYDVIPVLSQCAPDPDYTNTLSPNPEVDSSYIESIKLAKKTDADVIAITDPDGDRLGVVAKHNGEYVLMSGNQSAAVYLEYILSQLKAQGKLPDNAVMYNTIVTSDLGELVARSYGVDVEKTLTGFKFIGDKIRKYEKTGEKQFIFGYEESYGCVVKDFVRDKDAVQAVLLAAECGNYYKKQGKDLIDVLNDLYAKHGTFKESQIALAKAGVEGAKRIAEIMDNLRKDAPSSIGGFKVTLAEDYGNSTRSDGTVIDLPQSNVLKYYLEDGSWIAARPSGTEPKCKFYFSIKGNDAKDAADKTEVFQKDMMKIIGE
ncbi:MAG: phospho-sugar mutase [Eggerthia catenaformis]|uniref:phospho-sugar mutase n=1 Tax=Eggerthia catenaformis TaxID=31973 RepID=UPI003F9EE617